MTNSIDVTFFFAAAGMASAMTADFALHPPKTVSEVTEEANALERRFRGTPAEFFAHCLRDSVCRTVFELYDDALEEELPFDPA